MSRHNASSSLRSLGRSFAHSAKSSSASFVRGPAGAGANFAGSGLDTSTILARRTPNASDARHSTSSGRGCLPPSYRDIVVTSIPIWSASFCCVQPAASRASRRRRAIASSKAEATAAETASPPADTSRPHRPIAIHLGVYAYYTCDVWDRGSGPWGSDMTRAPLAGEPVCSCGRSLVPLSSGHAGRRT